MALEWIIPFDADRDSFSKLNKVSDSRGDRPITRMRQSAINLSQVDKYAVALSIAIKRIH